MTAENDRIENIGKERLAPAFEALTQISALEKLWLENQDEHTTGRLFLECMALFDRATDVFVKENQPVMAAWTLLQKASVTADLASSANPGKRAELARQALVQAGEGIQTLPSDQPPNIKAITRLYNFVIETLFKIRALLDQPAQVEALDALIKAFSAHFGEVQAIDYSTRSQAYDRLFTAQVLETLVEIEKDPHQRVEMLTASKRLGTQARQQLQFSSATDLTAVTTLLNDLDHKLQAEPATRGSTCPRCGAENPAGRAFCGMCGAQLQEEDQ